MSKNRTQEQQEYRDQLAHTIKCLRKYRKGNELAETLLDDEKNKYKYFDALGEGRKLDKKSSKKREEYFFKGLPIHDPSFLVNHLEKFDLDNNELAKKILSNLSHWFLVTSLHHFKWLDLEVADRLFNLWYDREVYDNIDSFNASAKKIIKQKMNSLKENASYDNMYLQSSDDEEQNAINKQSEYKKNIELEENIDVDYKHWKMSQEVKDYLNNPKTTKPSNIIRIDGQKIYITNLMYIWWGDWFLGFVKRNWRYDMNYYIKSGSEWLRRCMPGYADTGWQLAKMSEFNSCSPEMEQILKNRWFNFTKNFSYERTTMVDFRIQEFLDKKYLSSQERENRERNYDSESKDDYHFRTRYNLDGKADLYWGAKERSKEKLQRFIDMSKEIDVMEDFSSIWFWRMNKNTLKDVKNFYENETFWIDINSLEINPNKKYTYHHDYLGEINTNVAQWKLGWKDIEIFFSSTKNEPNLARIDQVQYKDQEVNSYWIASKQINWWLLTAKPIDYIHQTPKEWAKQHDLERIAWSYVDIWPIYQESPLIKKYKELAGIK